MIAIHPDTKRRFLLHQERMFASGKLSVGEITEELEAQWTSLHGLAGSVATSNGTTALELAAHPFAGGRPVALIPALAPPMVSWAVQRAGFFPRVMDVHPSTGCITMRTFQEAHDREVGLVVILHNGGVFAEDARDIAAWCRLNGVATVEDCSHAHLARSARYASTDIAGTIADAAAWSFYPTKVLIGTEGGIASFRNPSHLNQARVFANQGKARGSGTFGALGYNLRASELSACLMLAEVETSDLIIKDRVDLALDYEQHGLTLVQEHGSTYYKYTVLCDDAPSVKARLREVAWVSGGTSDAKDAPHASPFPPGARAFSDRHVNLPYRRFARGFDVEAVAHAVRSR